MGCLKANINIFLTEADILLELKKNIYAKNVNYAKINNAFLEQFIVSTNNMCKDNNKANAK